MSAESSPAAGPESASGKRSFGLQFSLRTLLFFMALVAVYFGGRASYNWRFALAPRLDGDWQAKLPTGFVQKTSLQHLGDGEFFLQSRATVLNGKYQWNNGLLIITEPTDKTMLGLTWKWDGTKLVLIDEPKNSPTGSSYVGTVLERMQPAQP